MNLYTVTIDFEDRTQAVMQVESSNEVEALNKALRESEALEDYDKELIEETIDSFIRTNHLAMGYKGVWLWHHCNFDNKVVADIYGGIIVQTDNKGVIREIVN